MNRDEYLLVKVAEEAAEVAQRATKALCFGMEEVQPGQTLKNRTRLLMEYADLCAVMEMIFGDVSDCIPLEALKVQKKLKVERYYQYSKEKCGTVTEESKDSARLDRLEKLIKKDRDCVSSQTFVRMGLESIREYIDALPSVNA